MNVASHTVYNSLIMCWLLLLILFVSWGRARHSNTWGSSMQQGLLWPYLAAQSLSSWFILPLSVVYFLNHPSSLELTLMTGCINLPNQIVFFWQYNRISNDKKYLKLTLSHNFRSNLFISPSLNPIHWRLSTTPRTWRSSSIIFSFDWNKISLFCEILFNIQQLVYHWLKH
jgi:hypothetical protein